MDLCPQIPNSIRILSCFRNRQCNIKMDLGAVNETVVIQHHRRNTTGIRTAHNV